MKWLFSPLRDEDVLIAGERVLYRKRRHWAFVMHAFAEFAAVLFLHSAFSMRATTGLAEILVLGTVVAVIVLRPLVYRRQLETGQIVFGVFVGYWALRTGPSVDTIIWLILLAMASRFVIQVLRWACFQRTYLTDRRLMEVDGFLGMRVSSMPLKMITDIVLSRSAMGELLGYGKFRVESAGQDQALRDLNFLLDPEHFQDMLVAAPSWRG